MSPVFVRRRTREAFELALDRNAPVELRLDALRAVAAAGSAQAAETLASLLDEDNDVIAELAVALLGHMPARRALAPLLDVMAGHDDLARLNAAEALGRIGEVAAGPALISALYSGDPDLRLVAARALGRVGDRRAVGPLKELLYTARGPLRLTLAEALAKLGDTAGRQLLAEALTRGYAPAAAALAETGGDESARALLAAIPTVFHTGDTELGDAIMLALGRIADTLDEPMLAIDKAIGDYARIRPSLIAPPTTGSVKGR